jgi:hypothetical protein
MRIDPGGRLGVETAAPINFFGGQTILLQRLRITIAQVRSQHQLYAA